MSTSRTFIANGRTVVVTQSEKKLPPELKAQWLAALRSGEYIQCTGQLSREVEGVMQHCCLGVLCRLQGRLEKTGSLEYDGTMDTASSLVLSHDNPVYFLTEVVSREEGIPCTLADLNDRGATFAEIADIIEYAF